MLALTYSLVSYSLGKEFPPEDPNLDPKKLGMTGILVTILSLSVLFITALIGYFWVRSTSISKGTWIPLGVPKIPDSLIISTITILFCSLFFHLSLKSFQSNQFSSYKKFISLTFFSGMSFIFFQILSWLKMYEYKLLPSTPNLYSFTFYFLTFLHAIHVLFGFFPLSLIIFRTVNKEFSFKLGNLLVITAIYWHFLDFVWLVLFIVLYFY